MTSRRSGFTLVELLVVIGIIIMVVGITIPAISAFMKGKSMENAGQTVQTVFMMARRASITRKVKHRVIFFARTIDTYTVYGMKIYRCSTPYDVDKTDPKAKPGENRGGYLSREYLLPEGLVPELYYTQNVNKIPTAGPPAAETIGLDKDGPAAVAQDGKIEFQKNGSLRFGGAYKNVASYDLEHIYKDGDVIPAVDAGKSPADIVITKKASVKSCYVDIMRGVGRAYVKILIPKDKGGTK